MTIASIKLFELAKHLQKMKGRIVYRGDCAQDEEGAAAVYRELGANPASVQGLSACMAYGALPGNATTTANAIKAYVQAILKSNFQIHRVAARTTSVVLEAKVRSSSGAAFTRTIRSSGSRRSLGTTSESCHLPTRWRRDPGVPWKFLVLQATPHVVYLCGRSHVVRPPRRAPGLLGRAHFSC